MRVRPSQFSQLLSPTLLPVIALLILGPHLNSLSAQEPISDYEDELCGWATHDSCPIDSGPISHQLRSSKRTSSTFDQSMAAAAATASASVGISVEQIVEPFAMVGPQVVDSIRRVREFQQWWLEALAKAQPPAAATAHIDDDDVGDAEANACVPAFAHVQDVMPVGDVAVGHIDDDVPPEVIEEFGQPIADHDLDLSTELDEELDLLTMEEPVDVDQPEHSRSGLNAQCGPNAQWGPSVLVTEEDHGVWVTQERDNDTQLEQQESQPLPDPSNLLSAAESQVGASAIIVSIEESYLPYDLSARDLRVWSVFPLVTEPFCIRSHGESTRLAQAVPDLESTPDPPAVSSETPAAIGDNSSQPAVADPADQKMAADCLLESWIWQLTRTVDENRKLQRWLRPRFYGRRLATVAVQTSGVAGSAAGRLASVWPDQPPVVKQPPEPSAGQRLLTRAGAVESAELDGERIAEVPETIVR